MVIPTAIRLTAKVTRPITTDLAASTFHRAGEAVNVTRIIPLRYSAAMNSAATMITTSSAANMPVSADCGLTPFPSGASSTSGAMSPDPLTVNDEAPAWVYLPAKNLLKAWSTAAFTGGPGSGGGCKDVPVHEPAAPPEPEPAPLEPETATLSNAPVASVGPPPPELLPSDCEMTSYDGDVANNPTCTVPEAGSPRTEMLPT